MFLQVEVQNIQDSKGSNVDLNIQLYDNPNIPFVIGQRYGYEIRAASAMTA